MKIQAIELRIEKQVGDDPPVALEPVEWKFPFIPARSKFFQAVEDLCAQIEPPFSLFAASVQVYTEEEIAFGETDDVSAATEEIALFLWNSVVVAASDFPGSG